MIPPLRRSFNERYTPERYQRFLKMLDDGCGTHVTFRNCETPGFLPGSLMARMEREGCELIRN
jgi:hypothetical protein